MATDGELNAAMKRKLGDHIRSKTATAQINEALLKVLCHNLICLIHEMHEAGAPFSVCPNKTAAAQQIEAQK